jgi:hypothetical protein
MGSDYDEVIAPSEYFATDEKGDAAFGEMRGDGPADRVDTYQGLGFGVWGFLPRFRV